MRRWERRWGIRHVRYWWYAWLLARFIARWQGYGGSWASKADYETLDAIWRGEA